MSPAGVFDAACFAVSAAAAVVFSDGFFLAAEAGLAAPGFGFAAGVGFAAAGFALPGDGFAVVVGAEAAGFAASAGLAGDAFVGASAAAFAAAVGAGFASAFGAGVAAADTFVGASAAAFAAAVGAGFADALVADAFGFALVFAVDDFGAPFAPAFGAAFDAAGLRALVPAARVRCVRVEPDVAAPVFVPPARAAAGGVSVWVVGASSS